MTIDTVPLNNVSGKVVVVKVVVVMVVRGPIVVGMVVVTVVSVLSPVVGITRLPDVLVVWPLLVFCGDVVEPAGVGAGVGAGVVVGVLSTTVLSSTVVEQHPLPPEPMTTTPIGEKAVFICVSAVSISCTSCAAIVCGDTATAPRFKIL